MAISTLLARVMMSPGPLCNIPAGEQPYMILGAFQPSKRPATANKDVDGIDQQIQPPFSSASVPNTAISTQDF
ncbi:hypothetical protein [Tabrizicola sp.]|uniref:hypothetical protein n=1 Tax=Tabrizicola sp. TaxID=2005166 RepID=UPI00260D3900|nr:hypothetical protein [Tabrizicola sp.]MDM7930875.1 hypothetical protein [Tabrizicola sp.]